MPDPANPNHDPRLPGQPAAKESSAFDPLQPGTLPAKEFVRGVLNALMGEYKDCPERLAAAVPGLVKALNWKLGWVRRDAAAALSIIGPASISKLVEALKDEDDDIRRNAALVLSRIHYSSSDHARVIVYALVKALKDDLWTVRYWAAIALGNIGPEAQSAEAVFHALMDALGDSERSVRQAATDAIKKIKTNNK